MKKIIIEIIKTFFFLVLFTSNLAFMWVGVSQEKIDVCLFNHMPGLWLVVFFFICLWAILFLAFEYLL
jgi:hypothetical protein